jgi:AbiV family abortive infection protein
MSKPGGRKIDNKTVAAMGACIDHARDLLSSARAVQAVGHANVAYHLATLALEEIGRRELLGVQSLASQRPLPPAWPEKHTQDHVKKLFWCFFGGGFIYQRVTRESLEDMSAMARTIHDTRLAGLYVEAGEDGLGIPRDAIKPEETATLIELALARLGMAESEKLREHIPDEEIELQTWFLKITEPATGVRAGSLTSNARLGDCPVGSVLGFDDLQRDHGGAYLLIPYKLLGVCLDLPPFLTQPVKTQNPFKGELSHGIVEKDVHQGVQAGRGPAVGAREFAGRGSAGAGSEPERAAPLAA